jgi:hypothetical protein
MKLKSKWSSHTDKDIDDATNKNSKLYDKEFTRQVVDKYGSVENYKHRLKREKIKQDEIDKKEAYQKALLNPNIKNNLITWTDKYKNGNVYEGTFGKEKCFEIKRGIITFSLKIIHEELKADNKKYSSMGLFNLQEKANKILKSNPEFLKKFK